MKLLILAFSLFLLGNISQKAFADGEDNHCSATYGEENNPGCPGQQYMEPYLGQDGKWHSLPSNPEPVRIGGPGPAYCHQMPGVC